MLSSAIFNPDFQHIKKTEKKKGLKMIKLPKTAKYIEGSKDHWIDIDGSVYAYDTRHNRKILIKKALQKIQGYLYCTIVYKEYPYRRSKRVHKLVAEAFIPNPNNYNIVGHRNNIKDDNRIENLYWTTISENTQKAYGDGLAKNDSGYDDFQSKPVMMFDSKTNKCIGKFGSICEATRVTGKSKTTITRQAKYKRPSRRDFYFRYQDDEDVVAQDVIGMFKFDTDKLVDVFLNTADASKKTGISARTIAKQVQSNRKPVRKRNEFYFLKLNSADKCEQTGESVAASSVAKAKE